MTGEPPVPPIPGLGAAGEHRGAAESAAGRNDYDTALRERYRAVVRGLEQGGVLEVRRSRTARETADAAVAALPDRTSELPAAAGSFDEVVYGGRPATEDEYRRLERADLFSLAPPPPPEPAEATPARRRTLRIPPLPQLIREPKFWAAVVAVLALALIAYVLVKLATAPTAPPPPDPNLPPPDPGDYSPPPPDFGEGSDSIFARTPDWLAYGGLQWLFCGALVVWWRARRRGALVGEPRPVQVAANELLAGQAALYRKSGDRDHVAALLRAATLRRIRPRLGVHADAPVQQLVDALAVRTGTPREHLGATLFGPVPDDDTLRRVAAQLDRIESEIG
ncbi:hypothetical protein BJY24_002606 [Nocardia transvalensis]|uniref:Protein-glutamine gamma-glutamyltransferase-like C-terminal domain-containing protein n=1 Tax=Nocardia transvalensis TaxID=37333 RepID=A0A7W9PDP4_9NOCA|nr:DUF4129 domain-containing protein [Nocardia transvalensis]MBB5913739.1 hypothetical protein [Nocardia transvalensis]